MSDSHEYIEAYFQNQLSEAEKKQFEEQCVQDENFAREVAFYISLSEAVRQKLLGQKIQQWAGGESAGRKNTSTPVRKMIFRKWLPYAAAACLIFAVALYFLFRLETPHQLAGKYTTEHFTSLSQTMNASKDSLQQGIAAYNNKDYDKALQLFEKIYQSHPDNSNAKKYSGLVYLVTKDYDKAIQQFDELADKQGLYKNPGLFLKAVTLLQRNKQGDEALAKQLLEQAVNEKAEGSAEAEKWLKKW